MTNEERQNSLDKKKLFASQKAGYDLTGKMDYCEHCAQKDFSTKLCICRQWEREVMCYCAKAYNRMIYANKRREMVLKGEKYDN